MAFRLGKRSLANLEGVHEDLVAVFKRAIVITQIDFVITDGLRTIEEQRALVAAKLSRTMSSRHLTGHAVDIAAIYQGKVTWKDVQYHNLAPYIKQAARDVRVPIQWGYDLWKWDLPHWQLPRSKYP